MRVSRARATAVTLHGAAEAYPSLRRRMSSTTGTTKASVLPLPVTWWLMWSEEGSGRQEGGQRWGDEEAWKAKALLVCVRAVCVCVRAPLVAGSRWLTAWAATSQ